MKKLILTSFFSLIILFLLCNGVNANKNNVEKNSLQNISNTIIERIAFGSCAKQWQHQTIWDAILAAKPDLWLFLGDAVYADTDGATAWLVSREQLIGEWNRLADKPEFQEVRAKIPMMAIWDNHDYGSHSGGAEFTVKEASKEVFLDFWGEPKDSPRWQRSGIYDAKIFGPEGKRVQVILLDTKYNRSPFKPDPMPKEERLKAGKVGGYIPDNDPAKTHLGEEQWAWLEEELKKPAEVRLLASSTQVIPNQKGMDEWANFPHERARLLDLCSAAGNAIILSGNVHFAEVSTVAHKGAAVVDTNNGLPTVIEIGHPHKTGDRQGPVGSGHRIETVGFAIGGGTAVKLGTIPGGDARLLVALAEFVLLLQILSEQPIGERYEASLIEPGRPCTDADRLRRVFIGFPVGHASSRREI